MIGSNREYSNKMKNTLSDFSYIVHYSRGTPFLSATEALNNKSILDLMNENNTWGLNRFKDPDYLTKRNQVEVEIRNKFLEMNGQPKLKSPIYFFLGRNMKFEEHSSNIGYKINLTDVPVESITFTYGDSLIGFDSEYRRIKINEYKNENCGKLFLKNDLEKLLQELNLITTSKLHIEAQLWVNPNENFPIEIIKGNTLK